LKSFKSISSFLIGTLLFSLIGCSTTSKQNATPALFDTRVEAEKAAKNFNCTGAHKMGEQWMPCKKHGKHEHHHHH
jgi:hypothetical protein